MAASARIVEEQPTVREELQARVAQLGRDFRLLSIGELCRRTDLVRQIARANRLEAVGRLAAGLSDALAREGRSTAVRPWLDALAEALQSDMQDEGAARAFMAAVGVRLAV